MHILLPGQAADWDAASCRSWLVLARPPGGCSLALWCCPPRGVALQPALSCPARSANLLLFILLQMFATEKKESAPVEAPPKK